MIQPCQSNQRVLTHGKQRRKGGLEPGDTMGEDSPCCCWLWRCRKTPQTKERGHLKKLQKVRDQILPESPEGIIPAHILILALWNPCWISNSGDCRIIHLLAVICCSSNRKLTQKEKEKEELLLIEHLLCSKPWAKYFTWITSLSPHGPPTTWALFLLPSDK